MVVDNRGDYSVQTTHDDVEIVRPAGNLRWIGSANYGLERAEREGYDACAVLNNDIQISQDGIGWLVSALYDCHAAAVAGPVYDCYWPHQRKEVDLQAADYAPTIAFREVPFCDGAALVVRKDTIAKVGLLDAETFGWHGYGADIDYGIRIRGAGMRSVVTEACFVRHERRATIRTHEIDLEHRILKEYQGGLVRKWGADWRLLAGLRAPLVDPLWDS